MTEFTKLKANRIEIELSNGETVQLELKYNPLKCMKIARDFPQVNDAFTMAVGENKTDISVPNLYNAVYTAYRLANMNDYMSFEDFISDEGWEFDMSQAMKIYYSMLDKNMRTEYIEELQRLAKK